MDQAPAILDALAEWQNSSSDTKATVALIVALDIVTLGFIYSEPSVDVPASFTPFEDIPVVTYAVPASNGTVLQLTQFLDASNSGSAARCAISNLSSRV